MNPTALLLAAIALAANAIAAPCDSLAKLSLAHTSITLAEAVSAGSFTPPGGRPIPNLPAFCRVAGTIKPSSDSDIRFEAWLPASGWNGRFEGFGNGGFAGVISFPQMAAAVSRGYATASTDTGHSAGGTDAGWALGHPEKVIDFGHRAIHETAVAAKAIVHAFYGDGPKRSYFNSCSNGGRQALMEVQRYPQDYDGIIAGAPANYWTHLVSAFIWTTQATETVPGGYIPAAKLPAIQAAAIAACDAGDGLADQLIQDPSQCHFDPAKLLCTGAESVSCLTAPQLATLKKVYAGPSDSQGKRVFPGFPAGGEAEPGGWAPWITGDAPGNSLLHAFGTQFFTNMVSQDPAWDFRSFQLDRDTQAADRKFGRILNATDPDLKPFRDRGGKLILYHGWSDAAIPAPNTIDYYRSVQEKLGPAATDTFVRLYLVPGMQHCGGGSGPNSFGQGGPPREDADHDIGRALERWVEEAKAPGPIIAARFRNAQDPASGVARSRPLCPYPQVARWKGSGSIDDAANFVCK